MVQTLAQNEDATSRNSLHISCSIMSVRMVAEVTLSGLNEVFWVRKLIYVGLVMLSLPVEAPHI